MVQSSCLEQNSEKNSLDLLQDIASSYPFPEFLEPISDGHFWDEIPERKYCIDLKNFHHNPVPEGLKAQLYSL